eukprot:SAG11_NODE_13801_length_638_cov_12.821892_1_plen_192_part_10
MSKIQNKYKSNNKMKEYTQIYDDKNDKMVRIKNLYGTRAKQLYKQLILAGTNPIDILPDGLNYYEKSNRFRRVKSKKPKVELKSGYNNYIGELTIRNYEALPEYKGFLLMDGFRDKLDDFLTKQQGMKVQLSTKVLMRKMVDGEAIAEDTRWIKSSQEIVTNKPQLNKALLQMSTKVQEAIPEQEAKNGSMW